MIERKISGMVILMVLVLFVFALCALAIGLFKAIVIWVGLAIFLWLMVTGIKLISD